MGIKTPDSLTALAGRVAEVVVPFPDLPAFAIPIISTSDNSNATYVQRVDYHGVVAGFDSFDPSGAAVVTASPPFLEIKSGDLEVHAIVSPSGQLHIGNQETLSREIVQWLSSIESSLTRLTFATFAGQSDAIRSSARDALMSKCREVGSEAGKSWFARTIIWRRFQRLVLGSLDRHPHPSEIERDLEYVAISLDRGTIAVSTSAAIADLIEAPLGELANEFSRLMAFCEDITGLRLALVQDAPAEPPPSISDRQFEVPPPSEIEEVVRGMILGGQAPPSLWIPHIRDLNFDGTELEYILPISNLTSLQTLKLNGTRVTNVAALGGLTALNFLDLRSKGYEMMGRRFFPRIDGERSLGNLLELRTLLLGNCGLDDISALENLVKLEILDLSGNPVADIRVVRNMLRMRNLNIAHTNVSDIAPLRDLHGLDGLKLNGTRVRDLGPLDKLNHLQYLELSGLEIGDISPLHSLTSIVNLDLSGTYVRDLNPVAGMAKLKVLNLSRTPVNDLTPLRDLPSLLELNLGPGAQCDLGILTSVASLKILRIGSRDNPGLSLLRQRRSLKILPVDHFF